MLQNYSPRAVSSDGNCFYRAMSLALYGTEQYHRYLRVKTALEMIANPALYTRDNPTFVGHGLPILTPEYRHACGLQPLQFTPSQTILSF